jgi:hypothetical protein
MSRPAGAYADVMMSRSHRSRDQRPRLRVPTLVLFVMAPFLIVLGFYGFVVGGYVLTGDCGARGDPSGWALMLPGLASLAVGTIALGTGVWRVIFGRRGQ